MPTDDDLDLGATIRNPLPGRRMFERYRLSRMLGRGGMGVVWLARDDKLERDVALKFLPDMVRLDAAAIDELKRETRRSLELTHPNIVRIHDFVDDDHTAAIAMEYVDGATVSALRVAKASRVFEPGELEDWVRQLTDALDYAHTRVRVVHRDLKPANLMVNRAGQLKLTDFGISRSINDSVSRLSNRAALAEGSSGTLAYMSPQQAAGGATTVGDDIYALGATLYELLTSKPPFYTGNLYYQIESVAPPPLDVRRRDLEIGDAAPIPEAWDTTVRACLAKDPAARPRSVGEVAERLGLRQGPALTPARASTPAPVIAPLLESLDVPPSPPPVELASTSPAAPARRAMPGSAVAVIAALALLLTAGIGVGIYYFAKAPQGTSEEPSRAMVRRPPPSDTAEGQPPVAEASARPNSRNPRLQEQSETQQAIERLVAGADRLDEARLRLRRYLETYGADAFYNATYARIEALANDAQARIRQQDLARAQAALETMVASDPVPVDEARAALRDYLGTHGRDAFYDAFYARLDRIEQAQQKARQQQESSFRSAPLPPSSSAGLGAPEVGKLIIDNLNALQHQDLRAFVSAYADRVSWFDDGTVNRDYIYRDKVTYFKTWPQLNLSMTDKIRVFDTERPEVKRAEFTYHFIAANPRTGKAVQGDSYNVWVVQKQNGVVSIVSTREQVSNRRSLR